MSIKGIIRLAKCKHIADFSEKEMITDFSLYQYALIDCSSITTEYTVVADAPPSSYTFKVPKDVKALQEILFSDKPIIVPCFQCRKEMAFKAIPGVCARIIQSEKKNGNNEIDIVFDALARNRDDLYKYQVPPFVGRDINKIVNEKRQICRKAIMMYFTDYYSEIRKEYICSYNNNHVTYVNYRIYYPLEELNEQDYEVLKQAKVNNEELYNAYETLRNCLVIQKVGQFPSIADMQSFDIEQYRSLLDGRMYRNLTRAIGLYADGIGCGAFLYLRRILEYLVEEKHQCCAMKVDWDEEGYSRKRFDEKVRAIESYGINIFPAPLERVKSKIYGILSKGVHESTDEECNELFPYVKFAIEVLLDEQLQERKKANKIKELEKKLRGKETEEG